MNDVLIIGYGNSLRGDDAIGIHAAHLLEDMLRDDARVRVIGAHQLTPEMAEDVSAAKFVLFVDASLGNEPGQIKTAPLGLVHSPSGFIHHCTPSALLEASEQLYGEAPSAMAITMTGAAFDVGRGLSPNVRKRMPELLRTVTQAITAWRTRNHHEYLQPVR